jgi:hypothetical protein
VRSLFPTTRQHNMGKRALVPTAALLVVALLLWVAGEAHARDVASNEYEFFRPDLTTLGKGLILDPVPALNSSAPQQRQTSYAAICSNGSSLLDVHS